MLKTLCFVGTQFYEKLNWKASQTFKFHCKLFVASSQIDALEQAQFVNWIFLSEREFSFATCGDKNTKYCSSEKQTMAGKQSKREVIRSGDVLRRLSCERKHSRVSWSVCGGRQAQNALHEILVFVDDWLELSSNLSITFQQKKTLTFADVPEETGDGKNKKNTKSCSKHLNNFWYRLFNLLELLSWRDRRLRRRCSRNCRRISSTSHQKAGTDPRAWGQPQLNGSCPHW